MLFSEFYKMVTMETMTVTKILTSVFAKFYDCTKFHYHEMAGKKLSINKIFNFLFLTTLKLEFFRPARNHGKKFPKLCQISFSGIVHSCC